MSATPEGAVLRAALDYLALCGIAAWRINTMGTPLAGQPGRFRPAPSKGIADIIGIAKAVTAQHLVKVGDLTFEQDTIEWAIPLAVEVKSATGRQSPAQREFQQRWEQAGGIYLLVRSVNELRDGLRGAGVEVR